MANLMNRDDLVAYLVQFSDRHQTSPRETLQFLLELGEELTWTEQEQLLSAVRSLKELAHMRNEGIYARDFFSEATRDFAVGADTGSGKTKAFWALLFALEERAKSHPTGLAAAATRGFGIGKGLIVTSPDFDEPLPADIQDLFEN